MSPDSPGSEVVEELRALSERVFQPPPGLRGWRITDSHFYHWLLNEHVNSDDVKFLKAAVNYTRHRLSALPPASDDVVERVARAIVRSRGATAISDDDKVWAETVRHYREMAGKHPTYAAAHSLITDAFRDARAALPTREEWQPIETAPRDGRPILVGRDMDEFGWITGTARWVNDIGGAWLSRGVGGIADGLGLGNPTHWCPLPDPPARTLAADERAK